MAEVSTGSGASDETQGWAHLLSLEVGFYVVKRCQKIVLGLLTSGE
jgi:hypothetical protein